MLFILSVALISLLSTANTEIVEFKNQLSGVIESPNFPDTYPNDLNKTWVIRVEDGYRIELFFTEFDLEDSYDVDAGGACVYDFVKVYDGIGDKKYCGGVMHRHFDAPAIGRPIYSSKNVMTMQLVSDYSNEEPLPKGFKAHFKRVDRDECDELHRKASTILEDWDMFLYCNQFCNNIPGSYYCSCKVGYKLHENKHTCTSDCAGKMLVDETGFITSSQYPFSYSKLAKCDWTIQQRPGIAIDVRFIGNFSIEEHQEEGCVYDWLQYEYGGVKSDRFCGKTLPGNGTWLSTNTHKVTVNFVSDLTIEQAGFQMEYRTTRVKCHYRPVAPTNGVVTTIVKEPYEFEDIVKFKCNIGYRLIGEARTECLSNGTWSAPEPICEIKRCKQPLHLTSLANGRIKQKTFALTYGSEIKFACYIWYEMISGTADWRCEDDETWHEAAVPIANNSNGNAPRCEPICGLKGNRKILSNTYDFGDAIPNEEDEEIITTHIYGGRPAKEAEWPWNAFIDLFNSGVDGFEFCGGSILSHDTVVTAAHCTKPVIHEHIRVFVGVTDRSKPTENMQAFSVKQVIEHEDYGNISTFENDIAVLKLNASINIGKYARPICLPRSQREKELPNKALEKTAGFKNAGMITGWGITESQTDSLKLLEARIPPMSLEECKRKFPEGFKAKVSDRMLCAEKMGADACLGDSGGPYMFKDLNQKRWFLNGIVSFGSTRECKKNTFGIYTDVSQYIPWLEAFLV